MRSVLHDQLLEQAIHLSQREPHKPLQASLRRSVSAAYYALFHFLIDAAVREFIGAKREDRPLRDAFARSFEHGMMDDVAKVFGRAPSGLPNCLKPCFATSPNFSPEIRDISSDFSELQDLRPSADYDRGATLRRQDADRAVWIATNSMHRWLAIESTREARVFLLALASWRGLRNR